VLQLPYSDAVTCPDRQPGHRLVDALQGVRGPGRGSDGTRRIAAHRSEDRDLRREILDRTLILNAAHLRKILAEYKTHFNEHRPHRALNQASPLRALPDPVDADIKVTRRNRLSGLLHEYDQVAYGGRVFGTDTD
jgi:transposase InsO family protein